MWPPAASTRRIVARRRARRAWEQWRKEGPSRMSPRMSPWSLIPGCYGDGLYFEGSTEEIEERESELGLGGQEPWWRRQEVTMNSNEAGYPRETVSLNPRLPLLL